MKKSIYYLSPLVVIPIVFMTTSLIEDMETLNSIAPYFLFVILPLFSILIGFLSPAKTKFDYIVTFIVSLSVFLSLFVVLLFDEGCDGKAQLSLHHALNMEYYKTWLPIALIMMVITFFASFKPIRNFVKNKCHLLRS